MTGAEQVILLLVCVVWALTVSAVFLSWSYARDAREHAGTAAGAVQEARQAAWEWLCGAQLAGGPLAFPDATNASAAPAGPPSGAAELHTSGVPAAPAPGTPEALRTGPYLPDLVSYRENGQPVLCRSCLLPIEPAIRLDTLDTGAWQHVDGGAPGCWQVSDAPQLVGCFAEPERVCSECGLGEAEGARLCGSATLTGAPHLVVWRCMNVAACYDRRRASRV